MEKKSWHMHCRTGMTCCCFTSQVGGFFTKLDDLGWENLKPALREDYGCRENLETMEKLRALRNETGSSVGALALAYLTHQPFPTFALAGGSRPEHIAALKEA